MRWFISRDLSNSRLLTTLQKTIKNTGSQTPASDLKNTGPKTQAIIIRDPRSECHRDTSSDGVYEWLHVS